MDIILDVLGGAAIFITGVVVGLKHPPQVTTAITALKTAEADAQAVIAKITAHKAS